MDGGCEYTYIQKNMYTHSPHTYFSTLTEANTHACTYAHTCIQNKINLSFKL